MISRVHAGTTEKIHIRCQEIRYFSAEFHLYMKDNIKVDHQELGREGMDWIELAKDRDRWRALVNAVMCLRVP